MSALRLPREERAYHVLKLCEYSARGLVPDLEDLEDDSMKLMEGSYQLLTGKLKYLLHRASAQWKPEFEKVLDSSHSIRIQKIDGDVKEARRGFIGQCMACGRSEKNCRYSIDLAGDLNPKAWLSGPLNVHDEYATFCDSYEKVYDEDFIEQNVKDGILPSIDKGCFIVGETCLRKAKLRYMLQTLLLETCYTSERDLENIIGSNLMDDKELTADTLYTITDKKCKEFVKYQDDLELAIADERRHVPDIASDPELWKVIDECRSLVANEDEDEFNKIIRRRAFQTMQNSKPVRQHKREEDQDESHFSSTEDKDDEEDDGEDGEEVPQRRYKRKRSCVIEDRESDYEESPVYGAGARGSCDVEEDATPPPRRLSRREPPESISGVIGKQRAAGTLPSRRDALIALMELQLRLQREDRARDSAACSNAVLTIQELLQKLEEMRHTV